MEKTISAPRCCQTIERLIMLISKIIIGNMKAKALRLPDDVLVAVRFAGKKEKIDEATTLRKLLRIGAERYVAECYSRGEVTLREAAAILGVCPREALNLFWDMGIGGNVGAEEAMKAISRIGSLRAPRRQRI